MIIGNADEMDLIVLHIICKLENVCIYFAVKSPAISILIFFLTLVKNNKLYSVSRTLHVIFIDHKKMIHSYTVYYIVKIEIISELFKYECIRLMPMNYQGRYYKSIDYGISCTVCYINTRYS